MHQHPPPPRRHRLAARVAAVAVGAAGIAVGGAGRVPGPAAAAHGGPGTAGSAGSAGVAGADELFFSNRYADAERAYTAALHAAPDDPEGHAGYSLFLTYRHDFAAAMREARRATEIAPASARAFAVLCRADDWANRIDDALVAGRRAVALSSEDVLAHLFLSEALADHGDSAAAQQEIDAASRLLSAQSPAYQRAEVQREEANLARDRGATPAEVAGFRAAYLAQPGWVERSSELASAYVDAGDLQGAHDALDKAVALAPDDPDLLRSLAGVSMVDADYAGADRVTAALVRLAPHDSGALTLAAHVAMAQHRDSDRARALLREALRQNPADAEAAAYLLFLDRDVVGDEHLGPAEVADAAAGGSSDLAPRRGPARLIPDPDAILRAHADTALAAVNRVRERAGLPAVHHDPRLDRSAAAHAFYWLFNNASPTVAKLGIHAETAGLPGFSGVHPLERAVTFGYRDGPVGEDITHRGTTDLAVGDWVDSVYHRFPILRPDLVAIGYADAAVGPLPIEDMEFGFSSPAATRHTPVVYPADGQDGLPTSFLDNELPDPVPPGGPRTTGYPVTVTFDTYSQARMARFELAGPDGRSLPAYVLSPAASTENSASLLPQSPLQPHTRYVAHIVATVDDKPYERTWSFITGG